LRAPRRAKSRANSGFFISSIVASDHPDCGVEHAHSQHYGEHHSEEPQGPAGEIDALFRHAQGLLADHPRPGPRRLRRLPAGQAGRPGTLRARPPPVRRHPVPALADQLLERNAGFFGADWWPYGTAANRHTIDTFLRTTTSLSERRLTIDEVLVPGLLGT
jgi:hypothetical protein